MILRIFEQGSEPRDVSLSGSEVVLGRSGGCDVVLQQRTVSGRHLRILDGFVVEDLGSRNGTYLDGRPLVGQRVCVGRRLALGGPSAQVEIRHEEGTPGAVLTAELERLRAARSESAASAHSSGAGSDGAALVDLLRGLLHRDESTQSAPDDPSALPYYVHKTFHFIRDIEVVVTRLAGELTGEPPAQTILPDSVDARNFKRILAEMLDKGATEELRAEFDEYFLRLMRWYWVSYDTYLQAANGVIQEVAQGLRPSALRRKAPVPWYLRWTKLDDLEYWRRSQEFLDERLVPGELEDRLVEIAQKKAMDLFREGESGDDGVRR